MMLDRIRESVNFWRQDKGEAPRAVVMSVESFNLIGRTSEPRYEVRYRLDAITRERTATLRVWGIPVSFDNDLAEGWYKIR